MGPQNGYETFLREGPYPYRVLCQGGPRYQATFRQRVLDLYKSYGLGYSKFDGYVFTCPERPRPRTGGLVGRGLRGGHGGDDASDPRVVPLRVDQPDVLRRADQPLVALLPTR